MAMKLSVRTKVANGLVICLLVPRVAMTASEKFNLKVEGLNPFSADDEFVLGPENNPFAMVRLQADPVGDPTGCVDPSGSGVLVINSPSVLTTAEGPCDPSGGGLDPSGCGPFGQNDMFEVSMNPPPEIARTLRFEAESIDPSGVPTDEVVVMPGAVTFGADACIPQSIWVYGQNDSFIDGDQPYRINVIDEGDEVVASIQGTNLDNDTYRGLFITLYGPTSLPINGQGVFTIYVYNSLNNAVSDNDLVIEPSDGLAITGFAAALASNGKFTSKGKISKDSGDLVFPKVEMSGGEVLIVTINVVLFDGNATDQKITARFAQPSNSVEVDNDFSIRTALP